MKWWSSHNLAKGAVTVLCFASLLMPKMLVDDLQVHREERVAPIVSCLQDEKCEEYIHWRDFIEIDAEEQFVSLIPVFEKALDNLEQIPEGQTILKDALELPEKVSYKEKFTELFGENSKFLEKRLGKGRDYSTVTILLTEKVSHAGANSVDRRVAVNSMEVSTYFSETEAGEVFSLTLEEILGHELAHIGDPKVWVDSCHLMYSWVVSPFQEINFTYTEEQEIEGYAIRAQNSLGAHYNRPQRKLLYTEVPEEKLHMEMQGKIRLFTSATSAEIITYELGKGI